MVTTITPTIVTLNTVVTEAPQPSQLQQSGAIVSCGGTTLTTGAYQYAGQMSAVTAIEATPLAITSIAWATGTATATVAAMTLSVGQTFLTTIAGATPAGYNGTYLATVATSTTFTYALATDPGTESAPGTYTPPYTAFVNQAATTFFAQDSVVGVYILELGAQTDSTTAITALTTWLTDNPGKFYALLVDSSWDSSALNTLAGDYANPNSQLYFLFDTIEANLATYAGTKSVIAVVPAPTAPATEITSAAWLYQWVQQTPSDFAPARPLQYRQLYGVTAWPTYGQSTAVNNILTAYGNIVYTGTEGGLPSSNFIFGGRTMDGKQAMFWYAVDWYQIQVKLALANAIINAANQNPPIVYNQQGINALTTVANDVGNSSISFGLNLTVVLTAQSFAAYTAANPSNYAAGIYGGFAATITPQLGFESITFNIDATTFA
jgi:hypothetical protein